MSGIYIPSMKIPKEPGAHSIRLFVREDGTASIWGLEEYIPHEPLEVILVPDHGRLIDADVLRSLCDDPHWCVWLSEIDDAPTIIPADSNES